MPGLLLVSGCDQEKSPSKTKGVYALSQATCVALNGEVSCWGDPSNFFDNAASGEDYSSCFFDLESDNGCIGRPARIVALNGASKILGNSTGGGCAVYSGGTVECWGLHAAWHDGATSEIFSEPTPVQNFKDSLSISLAGPHRCVVNPDGRLRCWGRNDTGQLGEEPSDFGDVTQEDLPTVRQVSTSDLFTCVTAKDDSVWCWGENTHSQIEPTANSTYYDEVLCSPTPVKVNGIEHAREVHVSTHHACALLISGEVSCWGFNGNGNLGDGTIESRPTPMNVDLPEKVSSLSVSKDGSAGGATCVVVTSGEVYCWGGGHVLDRIVPSEKLSLDAVGVCACAYSPKPIRIEGVGAVDTVSVGNSHACALGESPEPTVYCWGGNSEPPLRGCEFESGPLCTNIFQPGVQ